VFIYTPFSVIAVQKAEDAVNKHDQDGPFVIGCQDSNPNALLP
jgi:hypothetical protein